MSRTRKTRIKTSVDPAPVERTVTFINPGEWFKKRWLIGVGAGFFCLFYIVEADNESDAIDALTDSDWGPILKTDCDHEDLENCTYAGNYGDHIDLDDIRILERLT